MIWQPSKLTRTQLEERRLAGGRLLKQGRLSQTQIARRLGVSRAAVSQWAHQLHRGGLPNLSQRISTGRPARLTPVQQQALVRQLKRGALAAGFPTERWTLQRIQQVIKRKFKVTYHPNYVSRLLRQLGWTPQYPVPQAQERDDELVEAWLRQDWPRIKKARRIGAEIVLFDETGFSFLAPLGRSWAPRGQRPVLRRVTKERRVLSTAIGLTISGKIFKRHFERSMRGEEVIAALAHLRRHIPGSWILIWDRASIHRRVKVAEYLKQHPEIIVEWLPAYAPEINPEEYCHGNVKRHLKNAIPENRSKMRRLVDRGFARLRRRPDLLLGFFHQAGLFVKQLW